MAKDSSSILKKGEMLSGASLLQETLPEAQPVAGGPDLPLTLPSGRRIGVTLDVHGETLEVYGEDGTVEVQITLTEEGPRIRLSGATLELDAVETLSLRARNIDVAAQEGLSLQCAEDMNLRSDKDVHVQGAVIWLN